jgi:hypothetical protein
MWPRASALILATLGVSCGLEPMSFAFTEGCEETYRMQVWESGDTTGPPDAEYLFALGTKSTRRAELRWSESRGPLRVRSRSLDLSPRRVGPAAPDAACRDRTIDPFEDFVALTFPQLNRENSQAWTGAMISGDGTTCEHPGSCCAALACGLGGEVEPRSEAFSHCQLGSWREERELGNPRPALRSSWENGQKGSQMARAERFVEFNAHRGRPVRARIDLWPAPGRQRHVEIVALDACNGIQPLATDPGAQERLAQIAAWAPPSEDGQRERRTKADGQDRH